VTQVFELNASLGMDFQVPAYISVNDVNETFEKDFKVFLNGFCSCWVLFMIEEEAEKQETFLCPVISKLEWRLFEKEDLHFIKFFTEVKFECICETPQPPFEDGELQGMLQACVCSFSAAFYK